MASATFATAAALRRAEAGALTTSTGPVTEAVVTELAAGTYDWCGTETRPDDGFKVLQAQQRDSDGAWIYRPTQGRWVRRSADGVEEVGGAATITIADSATATQATEAETAKRRLKLTGTLSAARSLVLADRAAGAEWVVENACNLGVAVSCGSSSSTTIPAGDTMTVSLGA